MATLADKVREYREAGMELADAVALAKADMAGSPAAPVATQGNNATVQTQPVSGAKAAGISRDHTGFEWDVKGDTLTIKVKLNQDGWPSGSGKSMVLANSRGNTALPDGKTRFSLNVFRV